MVVGDLESAVSFLGAVFGAVGEVRAGRPAEIRIGDSFVMIRRRERGNGSRVPLRVRRGRGRGLPPGIAAGAVSLEEQTETPYGDRRAMVRDPFDNVFRIARCGRD
jgi:hypothetical protein